MAILIAQERFRDFRIAELRWRLQRTERRQQLLLASLLLEEEDKKKNRSIHLKPACRRQIIARRWHVASDPISPICKKSAGSM